MKGPGRHQIVDLCVYSVLILATTRLVLMRHFTELFFLCLQRQFLRYPCGTSKTTSAVSCFCHFSGMSIFKDKNVLLIRYNALITIDPRPSILIKVLTGTFRTCQGSLQLFLDNNQQCNDTDEKLLLNVQKSYQPLTSGFNNVSYKLWRSISSYSWLSLHVY